MKCVEGMIFQDSGFIKGYIYFEEGKIIDILPGSCPDSDLVISKGVVLPLLNNCHTHIGDAIAHGRKLTADIEKLVAPPDGLKFQILRSSSSDELKIAMHRAIIEMLNTGTGAFSDFREDGVAGIQLLKNALNDLPITSLIMGRPRELKYSEEELSLLLPKVDGLGLSSITDWDYSELMKIAKEAKRQGRLFALHASERHREDIDLILDLKPDFLVHMTYGTDDDYQKLAECNIPIVLCLRSNLFFKNIPNLKKMLESGVTIVLGSDNAMINSSNLFEEVRVCTELLSNQTQVDPMTVLSMVTSNAKSIFGPKFEASLKAGNRSNFMVLEIPKEQPQKYIVKGIDPRQIKYINIGDSQWEKKA
ncbi:MAG: amidohydrolase family protein [Promethearchaeota archaeon]|jgi:cytosine/adenosine deaminase-related metal-dependent hydrolase